jgi:hypothetical protein
MSRGSGGGTKLPFENTTETLETPDLAAFRAFDPNLNMLRPALDAQLNTELAGIRDTYGAYTNIPSAVSRLTMKRRAEGDAYRNRGLALAEGNDSNQRLKLAQLESLANLTAKKKSSGFQTAAPTPGGGAAGILGGIGGLLGGAGAAIGALGGPAAIGAAL